MTKHSLSGIIRAVNAVQQQIALNEIRAVSHSSQAFRDLHKRILDQIMITVDGIDRSLSARDLTGADLAIRSRRAYQWLKFLTDPDSFYFHLDALQRMAHHLDNMRKNSRIRMEIKLYHQGSLYKVRHQDRQVEMIAQESFLTAPDKIIGSLVEVGLDPSNREVRSRIQDYSFSTEYQKYRERLEYLGIPAGSFSAGEVHHLEDSFDRVNQTYFQGKLNKPHLVWNQRLTHRKFGHYQWDTDTVMVSSSLDDKRVPEMVVDFVIYHELLHMKIGFKRSKKNRIAHSRDFRMEEEQFLHYKKARQFLNTLSNKRARYR